MGAPTTRARTNEPAAKSASPDSYPGQQKPAPRWIRLPPPYPVRRFTVAEYEKIAKAGILTEDDNVELLEGWIVPKMTKYPPHDGTIDRVAFLLAKLLPPGWFPRVQNVVVTSDSEPEPDVTVVRGDPGDYCDRHPTGADIGLIVEVADSTVRRDRRKANIYARAGVPAYWIINLDERQIETYTQIGGKGKKTVYQSTQILLNADDLAVLILDGKKAGKLSVADLLPPERTHI